MKPRLLVLTSSFMRWKDDFAGGGHFVYMLSKSLRNTFDVFVLSPRSGKSKKEEVIDGLNINRFNQFPLLNIELTKTEGIPSNLSRNKFLYFALPFYLLLQYLAISRVVKSKKIDIIHAHWIIPQALLAVLFRKMTKSKVKIIATIHGSDFWGFNNKLGRRLKKYVFDNIDELTVVSTPLRDAVHEFGYKKEIYVYPMGIDTSEFSPEIRDSKIRKELRIEGECLLFVGSCVEEKGIRFLIEAMPTIIREYPKAKLIVVGEGNIKSDMIKLSEKLLVKDSIIFTGIIANNQLPEYYTNADLFILPSFSEGFPVSLMEAMSCGCIPICSDIHIFKSVLEEGKTGFIVELKSSKSISDKVISALKSKEIEKIRNEVRSYAVENFDWSIVSKNYESILEKVLKG